MNMQLIRAINKSNKSNNNNLTSSGGHFNKVVIVAPPATNSSVSQSQPPPQPVSPSVALPALKKRTAVVKQSVPPPVPPRGSPRSKSKCIGRIDVNQLATLSCLEQSGCQKVEKWLETIPMSIPEDFKFKSVKLLAENFAPLKKPTNKSSTRRHQISDSSFVKIRVESYDSLSKTRNLKSSDTGTDSGIDIATSRTINDRRKLLRTFEEFV
jgi:hypothetical protein